LERSPFSFVHFACGSTLPGFIGADGRIRLHVAPEVSTLDFANSISISGFVVPAISTRRAETEIELKDGRLSGSPG